jgi:GNAT superfamily N-acetyltransferase
LTGPSASSLAQEHGTDSVTVYSPVQLAGGIEARPGTAELVSMWVHPRARGHGAGEALVSAVTGWAADQGFESVHLWVTEANSPARWLYERCGFMLTGERQPLTVRSRHL